MGRGGSDRDFFLKKYNGIVLNKSIRTPNHQNDFRTVRAPLDDAYFKPQSRNARPTVDGLNGNAPPVASDRKTAPHSTRRLPVSRAGTCAEVALNEQTRGGERKEEGQRVGW